MTIGVLGVSAAVAADAPMLTIDLDGSTVDLEAATIDTIFQTPDNSFSALDLEIVTDTLVNGGINTSGFVTLFLADTADGFSLIALMDGLEAPPDNDPPVHSLLGINAGWSAATDTSRAYTGPGSWMVNQAGDHWIGGGAFAWQHETTSAAVAFSNLQLGDSFDIDLVDLGLIEMQPELLQLISYNTENGFTVAGTGALDESGQISFNAVVQAVPAPASVIILSAMGLLRRRRRS